MVADDSRWHHLFVTWSSENGDWQLYRNGVSVYTGTGLAKGTTIKGMHDHYYEVPVSFIM